MTSKFNFGPCPLPPLATVWAYLRDSGGESQDLASQRAYVIGYCEHHQLRLERVFEDAAISGGSVTGRSEFEAMIDIAGQHNRPQVEAVLYWDMKRFARNELDSQFFMADLRRRGYRLVSLSDEIPDGEFAGVVEAFLRWKAQKDREDISKDSRRGLAYIVGLRGDDGRYLGLFPGRPPTFFTTEPYDTGLRRNDGRPRIVQRLIPDPATWELGRQAWAMRAAGASYREIEAELRLFPRAINPSGIYSTIFRNEIYIGRLHYGGRWYDDFVPALATAEQWRTVQAQRYRRGVSFAKTQRTHPKAEHGGYLLSGLCRCMYCQAAMHGERNVRNDRAAQWRYYVCNQKKADRESCPGKQTSAEKLEQVVVETVCGRVLTIDMVHQLADRVAAELADTGRIEREIEQARAEITRLEKAIKNLLYMAELSPSPALAQQLNARELELEPARRKLAELRSRTGARAVRFDPHLVTGVLNDWRGGLRNGSPAVKRRLLRRVVSRVEVSREAARLHCCYDMTRFYTMPPTGLILETCQVNILAALV